MVGWRLDPSWQGHGGAELTHKFNLQYWMQLNAVFRHPGLTVKDIKETYTLDAHDPRRIKPAKMCLRRGQAFHQHLPYFDEMLCLR